MYHGFESPNRYNKLPIRRCSINTYISLTMNEWFISVGQWHPLIACYGCKYHLTFSQSREKQDFFTAFCKICILKFAKTFAYGGFSYGETYYFASPFTLMDYATFSEYLSIPNEQVLNVYQYGSRVYGTSTDRSDWDFVVIVNHKTVEEFLSEPINVHFYTVAEFQAQLAAHEISALECLFLPAPYVWKEQHRFEVNLVPTQLRHSLPAKSSNSWVKCKKKLTLEKDYDLHTGRKSLFHAFRIIHYGIQLCQFGRITDYTAANAIYEEICQYERWEDLFAQFKPRYNQLLSTFRLMAPKL